MTLVLYILVRSQIQCTWINREKKIVKLKLDVQSRTLCYNKIIQDISQSWIYVFLTTDQPGITRDDKSILYSYNSPEQELQIFTDIYFLTIMINHDFLFYYFQKRQVLHTIYFDGKKKFLFFIFIKLMFFFLNFYFVTKNKNKKKKWRLTKNKKFNIQRCDYQHTRYRNEQNLSGHCA